MVNTQEFEQRVKAQQPIVQRFQSAIRQNELAHAYLLTGPSGAGKTQVAQWVAMRLFCLHVDDAGNPDLTCEECQRILQGVHPDVMLVAPDGRQIKVEQVRFLKSEFSKSAVEGNQKVFIIQSADKMTVSAANSLLKFLEEPVSAFVAFLITTNKGAILPTIQSRTQIVEFPGLPFNQFKQLLVSHNVASSVAGIAANLTNSLSEVQEWQENDWLTKATQAVGKWYQLVSQADMRAFVTVASDLMAVADNRSHQQTILDMIMLIWRDTMLVANEPGAVDRLSFSALQKEITHAAQRYQPAVITGAAQLTLRTKRLLDQNISFQNILEELTIRIINELSDGSEV